MKIKHCLVILFILAIQEVAYCQNTDKVNLLVHSEKYFSGDSLQWIVKIKIVNWNDTAIKFKSNTNVGEFVCSFNAAVWIKVEQMFDSCFNRRVKDCIPDMYPAPTKILELRKGDSYTYTFNVSHAFSIAFYKHALFRFKVFHRITVGDEKRIIESDWLYFYY